MVIIARDEVDRLPDALRSVAFADEIVVLDSGSTDGTVEVAREGGARVVETDWPGFVAQKNRALGACTGEWIFSLDADERVSPALAQAILAAVADPGDKVAFRVNRQSWWMGAPLRHGSWYPDAKIRLLRRGCGRWTGREPHDQLAADGPIGQLSGDLHHHPYRNLGEHLATIDRYTALAAAELRREGVRAWPWDLLLRPPLHFVDAYLLRLGMLDGVRGLCVAGLGSIYVLLKWARLALGEDER